MNRVNLKQAGLMILMGTLLFSAACKKKVPPRHLRLWTVRRQSPILTPASAAKRCPAHR